MSEPDKQEAPLGFEPGTHGSNPWLGVYHLADPKITLASVASMIVGATAASFAGPLSWPWLALTVFGVFCVEAAKNASGEIFDWDSGTDRAIRADERTPFSGGKRVLVDGLLSRRQTAWVAFAFYTLGAGAGLAIVGWREFDVLWLGIAGLALAFFYHAPPLMLSYRGLGELAVAVSYGPIIAAGTFLVQRGTISYTLLLPTIPLGLLIMAFLWINEFPDARADEAAGKRTLVVRLGRDAGAAFFVAIIVLAWLGVAALPLFDLPATLLIGFIGLPLSLRGATRLWRNRGDVQAIIPAQGQTLLSFVLMSVGIGMGFVLG